MKSVSMSRGRNPYSNISPPPSGNETPTHLLGDNNGDENAWQKFIEQKVSVAQVKHISRLEKLRKWVNETRLMQWLLSTRCFGKSRFAAYREKKLYFISLPEEQKRARARQLWKTLRLKLKIFMAMEFSDDKGPTDDAELLAQLEWFQFDPRNSTPLFVWTCVICVAFLYEMIFVPLALVWPELIE